MLEINKVINLNSFLDWWFVAFSTFNDDAFGVDDAFSCFAAAIAMKFQQFRQVETWLLQYFNLAGER